MSVQPITIFRTSDGRTFTRQEDAETHERASMLRNVVPRLRELLALAEKERLPQEDALASFLVENRGVIAKFLNDGGPR